MLLQKIPAYYAQRRKTLTNAHPGAVFLFPSAHEALRNPDVYYPFRQESQFYYLTGFDEPESFLVLAQGKMTLFVRRRDPEREMWEGERYGLEGAAQIFGADQVYPIDELADRLPDLIKGADSVFYRAGLGGSQESMDRLVFRALEKVRAQLGRSGKALQPICDPSETLGEMRLFKSAEEVELLRQACRITARAHRAAMMHTLPEMNEGEIEALIDYQLRKGGCTRLGYGSIVAGGRNAACLHYHVNNEMLHDGDLLLIDAGGEFGYYTSDITRTFPVGKAFSVPQAELYDLVLDAQKQAIAMAKPGATLPAIHAHVNLVLTEGMLRLGLLKGNAEALIKAGMHRRFYPHNTSHWLGMDVHDVGLYQKSGAPRKLEPGMCFTIEPGFYIQPGDRDVPSRFQTIGIRIEDDVLITPQGCEVLTQDAPKERQEIEAIRHAARAF